MNKLAARLAVVLATFALLCSCAVKPVSPPAAASAASVKPTTIYFGDGAFYLQGSVNKVPELFVVDTGATFVSFPSKDVEKLHLILTDDKDVAVIADGSFQQTTFVKVLELKVGNCILNNVQAEVTDNQNVALLGLSAFDHLTMTMRGNQMSFFCD